MSLRRFRADGGKACAGRRVLPALVAFCWLLLAPRASYALSLATPGGEGNGPAAAAQVTATSSPATAGPLLSLVEEVKHPGGRLSRISLQPGRGSRLSIGLFSAGSEQASAGLGAPGITGLAETQRTRPGQGLLGLLEPGSASDRHATLFRLDYAGGPVELKGHLVDVGARFALSPGNGDQPGAEEAELLRRALGGRGLKLSGAWKLTPGLSLTSSHDALRRDGILSEQRGLTSSDTSHALALALGTGASLTASLTQHKEEWDRELGRAGAQRREQRVELTSGLGPKGSGGLRLAMASVRATEGENRSQESTREAHLSFSPVARLRLTADHVAKTSGEGSTQTTQTVSAALKLTQQAELTATMKSLTPGAGAGSREAALSLAAKIAGGEMTVGQKQVRSADGMTSWRALAFGGGIGRGAGRVNLKLDFNESRGDKPEAQLARNALLRLDRQLLPWLTVLAERRETARGTMGAPELSCETKYEAVARLGGKTELSAGLVSGERAGTQQAQRRLALSHELGALRARVESGSWEEGADRRSVLRSSLDLTTGQLPEWAKTLSSAHQFEEAPQYLLGRKPEWSPNDIQFAGYRLWATQRAGGPDGVSSFGLLHRRVVAGRYHLQLAFDERPEGTEGDQKGRPLALRRESVEIDGRAFGGLNLRCGLGLQTGLDSPDNGIERMKLGLWGKLRPEEQVEADVWHESGRWEATAVARTSVTLLYSHRVSEENRVELKLGYTWGDEANDDRSRDCRLALAYEKGV